MIQDAAPHKGSNSGLIHQLHDVDLSAPLQNLLGRVVCNILAGNKHSQHPLHLVALGEEGREGGELGCHTLCVDHSHFHTSPAYNVVIWW